MKRNPFIVTMIILGAIFGFFVTPQSSNANNQLFVLRSILGAIGFGCISLGIEIILNDIVK